MFNWRKTPIPNSHSSLRYTNEAIFFDGNGVRSDAQSYLDQLVETGLANVANDAYVLCWDDYYKLLVDEDHASSIPSLGLPNVIDIAPVLQSTGTLDASFAIQIVDWQSSKGVKLKQVGKVVGGIIEVQGKSALLSAQAWKVADAVQQFGGLPATGKSREANYRHWGRIRHLAVAAKANFSDFLQKAIVLTPNTLRLELEAVEGAHRVNPTFQDAPDNWLSVFDSNPIVHDYYKLDGASGGSIYVTVTPAAARILREVKRMPKRMAEDDRARSFIRNPYAILGEEIAEVLNPDEHEKELGKAGFVTYQFGINPQVDSRGNIQGAVFVAEATRQGVVPASERFVLKKPEDIEKIISDIRSHHAGGFSAWLWDGLEIEVPKDLDAQIGRLQAMVDQWRNPKPAVTYEEIYDFSQYSQRVLDIAQHKPYYSPFVLKKDNATPWMPGNTLVMVAPTQDDAEATRGDGAEKLVLQNKDDIDKFEQAVTKAKGEGKSEVEFGGLRNPIPMVEAVEIVTLTKGAMDAVAKGEKPSNIKSCQRTAFVISTNFIDKEYVEGWDPLLGNAQLSFDKRGDEGLVLPSSLIAELKQHQRYGVAWLQYLFKHSPRNCTGCILADDMGLGKTLQLLTFIAHYFESGNSLPVLVVAPVSLLENWQNEISKFFNQNFPQFLTLYGKSLADKKVSKALIDKRLSEEKGLANFLVDGWRGNSSLVLTTYETLRDLSISLGRETWGIMVCDEAQKIKTPGTLVTDAAKAQKAHFKIACTGTPVENSLIDLWCLMDFVQPGLLGPLNTFGLKYRRPIEIERDGDQEQASTLRELQDLIDPLILRRMKSDVATDLPKKFDDHHEEIRLHNRICINDHQLNLYNQVIQEYRNLVSAMRESGKRQSPILMMLHRLRSVCADPRPHGLQPDMSQTIEQYRQQSPKFNWLIQRLDDIRNRNEKVLIFTEYIDLQRMLQHYIGVRYQLGQRLPRIINGAVKSSSQATESRQKYVDEFQSSNGFNVLILSPVAAGVGLNIQAANHVIHYTRTWNPAKEDQATDRAYRIGSTKDVFVYYPTIFSETFLTFEDKLDQLLRRKRELAANMLNGTPEVSVQEFEDIFRTNTDGVLQEEEYVTYEHFHQITGKAFEVLCRELWQSQGYKVIQTKASGDGGIDLVASKSTSGLLIQCKSSADTKSLGWEGVKDVIAGAAAYENQFKEIKFRKVAVTNQHFNITAIEQAKINDVHLVDAQQLKYMLEIHPVKLSIFSNL